MDTTPPSLDQLFAQLGLPNAPHEISAFIDAHRPLDGAVRLRDAPFWNAAQAALIREKITEDGNWALVVDGLNAQLREHPAPGDRPPP